MFYTYVLQCQSKDISAYYVGYCSDLRLRLDQHRQKQVKTTQGYDKITLVYYEACLNKTDARKRELQLKTGFGRGYLKKRIAEYIQGGIS